ncbi:MAG: mandelate racemase/muconate lactonizing enzyme family protein [Firmicutes bacterium]|nr:mandelate racemase/muconate lactonizing enzyme family protein [Bacillota bacterium]
MSQVEAVDVFSVAVPTPQTLSNSQKQFTEYHFVIARVRTALAEGWGWAYTQGVAGDLVGRLASSLLQPAVIGREPSHTNLIWRDWAAAAYSIGMTGLFRLGCAALDIALWDVLAREQGKSLTDLLGGAVKTAVPGYFSHLNLLQEDEAMVEEATAARQQGFRQWKMKVGRTMAEDVGRIRRVKELGLEVMVDANQKFLRDEAVRRALAYRDAGAWFLEEPVSATDWDGYRTLASLGLLTIAGGESLYQPEWFDILDTTGVQVWQPDIFRVGGITPLLPLLHKAAGRHQSVMLHCGEELATPIAMAFDIVRMVEHLPAIGLYELGLVDQRLAWQDGLAVPLAGPGHGVRFAEDRLREFRQLG